MRGKGSEKVGRSITFTTVAFVDVILNFKLSNIAYLFANCRCQLLLYRQLLRSANEWVMTQA